VASRDAETFSRSRRLELDSEFRLKERVTTSLMMRDDEAASPAGVACWRTPTSASIRSASATLSGARSVDRFPGPACVVVLLLLIYSIIPISQALGSQPQVAPTPSDEGRDHKMKQQLQAKREARKEKGRNRRNSAHRAESTRCGQPATQ